MKPENSEMTAEWLEEQFLHFTAEPKATFDPYVTAYQEESEKSRLSENPVVSVKVLTYKQEHLIERTLDSIVSQEVDFPIEILLCDDCSPDSTPSIARRYQEKFPDKIRYIRTDNNVGPNQNSRLAEILARGKYLAICEGDDYWHDPSKLREQVQIMEKHPLVSVVHTRVRNQRGLGSHKVIESRQRGRQVEPGVTEDVTDSILAYQFGVHNCSSVIRAKTLHSVLNANPELFNSSQFIHGDVPRYLRLSRLGGFYFLDKETATYQINEESLSQSTDQRKRMRILMSSHLVRWDFALRALKDKGVANEIMKRFLFRVYFMGRFSQQPTVADWSRKQLQKIGSDIPLHRRIFPNNPLRQLIRSFLPKPRDEES